TGSTAMAHDELKSVEAGMGLAGLMSLILVVSLLLIGFRSFRMAAATFATLVMGLIWTAGFAVFAVGAFNLISVAFAVLFIGLSVDFGIHFGLRYRESLDSGGDHTEALRTAARSLGGALSLCALAAAIGFFSFLPTDYRGLAELGLIAGAGMMIALFSNFTVLPALLSLSALKPAEGRGEKAPASARYGDRIARHARPILWGALIVAAAAAMLLPRARFDVDPLNLRDPETESVATYFDLIKDDSSGPYSATVLSKNLNEANELADQLNKLDEVKGSKTLTSFLPEDQDEKLEAIDSMALFLEPAFASATPVSTVTADQNRGTIDALLAALRRLAKDQREETPSEAANRLVSALEGLGGGSMDDASVADMQNRLVSALPARLEHLRQSLLAGPVEITDIPAEIAGREVAPSGVARLKVYPRENLTDRDALRRFVTAVQGGAPGATGGPVIILEAGDAVVQAFREAATLSIVAIGALLLLVLRNLRDSILVFAPLLLATLLTVGFSVLFAVPFNFANIIVLPLLFGLGVANGIHVVMRARGGSGAGVFATSTPRAVVFSALTTIGSFSSLAMSGHPGTSSMGVLLTVAITLTLISTLVLLPALMARWGAKNGAG
ncbi:MAG: MMPL family transporter, partial [Rhodospirillales bacterium]|nr:MMPL family transporter [Rhodospirillales bacterium]